MLSPDDFSTVSENVFHQDKKQGGLTNYPAEIENSKDLKLVDGMQCPSSSRLEEEEKGMNKYDGFSKGLSKYDTVKLFRRIRRSKPTIVGKQRQSMSRQHLLDYIDLLQTSLKKKQSVIRYLKLKLKKCNCTCGTSNCTQKRDVGKVPEINSGEESVELTVNRSQKKICPDNSSGVLIPTNNMCGQKPSKSDSVFHDMLAENVKEAETDGNVMSRLSDSKECLAGNGENSSLQTCSEHCNSKDASLVNNCSDVQVIVSDSRVHLYSAEMTSRCTDISEFDEEVKKNIEEFMVREDVSEISVKLKEGGKVVRYRRHYLGVLYKQFRAEVSSKCTFSQFCKSIPKHILKPCPTHWKSLVCPRCENTELKFTEITKEVLRKDMSLEEVLAKQNLYEQVCQELGKLRNSTKPFTYTTWAKTLLGKLEASERIVTTTVGSACTDILKQLDLLKEHLIRCYDQYEAVREAREETEISPIHAMVHIDWYESPATFVARHLHTSYYYGDGFKTLHAGYVRTQCKSYGFASLSDCKDHTAPAVWASINDILVNLAKEGMKVITVVSDSATAQYRNKGNFYLMRRFAKQNSVEMKWIYLEGGHGKGIADDVGASIKQVMCETIAHNPNKSFRNTMDILPIIKDLTPVKLFTYTENLVQQYKNLLSRQHLQVIPSTYKIREVCVKETSFYVKESSADKLPFFSLDTQVKGNVG